MPPAPGDANLRQPAGLKTLFLAEMWERFSYYGMRALLVLYLVKALGYSRGDAQHLYGVYAGLVYLTPVIGGWLADRFLGARLAAIVGGTTMMIGHFAMAIPSMLPVALGCLIVGNGFFKPNTTAMVGQLYPTQDDPRRDAGYTYFYMGINLGAFIAPFVAGTLGETVGWHIGFASAGVGMALGLVNFLMMQKLMGRAGLRTHQLSVGMKELPAVLLWTALAVGSVYLTLAVWTVVGPILEPVPVTLRLIVAAIVAFAGIQLYGAMRRDPANPVVPLTRAERGRVAGIVIMVIFVSFFWLGFEQAGGSMNLFADEQTDRHIAGPGSWMIPASWFQAINPVIILALGPVFATLWTRMNASRYAISDTAKQGWGMVVLGLGFVVLAYAQSRATVIGQVAPWWLVGVYFLHTVGELMASPVGLAMVSRVAPARMASLLMGVWFLSSAVAQYYAGDLENLLKPTGIQPYVFLIGSSIGAGVLLLLISPLLNKLMGEDTSSHAAQAGAAAGTATAPV